MWKNTNGPITQLTDFAYNPVRIIITIIIIFLAPKSKFFQPNSSLLSWGTSNPHGRIKSD